MADAIFEVVRPAYAAAGGERANAFGAIPQHPHVAAQMQRWLDRGHEVARDQAWDPAALRSFEAVLAYIWIARYAGACHSTSAALYMLMRDAGLEPEILIGEVTPDGKTFFDHSWLEIDGSIIDPAVSFPDERGVAYGGPVFASIDLATGSRTALAYGRSSGLGFGPEAAPALDSDFMAYSSLQPDPTIWCLASGLSKVIGKHVDADQLKARYGAVKRVVRGA